MRHGSLDSLCPQVNCWDEGPTWIDDAHRQTARHKHIYNTCTTVRVKYIQALNAFGCICLSSPLSHESWSGTGLEMRLVVIPGAGTHHRMDRLDEDQSWDETGT